MISFDTFLGEAHGVIDELKDGTIKDDELPHRRSSRRSSRRRSRRSESHDTTPKLFGPASSIDGTDDDFSDDSVDQPTNPPPSAPHSNSSNSGSGDSRVQNWFQLLSLKNHTGDARRALVHRLLGVNNVNELVLSKATQDQIASAANDAITDEILATVDQEDQRRKSSVSGSSVSSVSSSVSDSVALIVSGGPNQYSTYRVLELVDVLDSTTGGMVKRILTNVRRRATPVSQQHSSAVSGGGRGFSASRKTEFCGFCLDYRSHNTTQHKCRICGALGQHRSQYCTQPKASTPKASTPKASTPNASGNGTGVSTPRSRRRSGGQQTPTQLPPSSAKAAAAASEEDDVLTTASRLTPDASDKSFCTFCSTWGFHSTENHRCRICGVKGVHRSRNCAKKSSGEGYRWRGSPAEPPLERKHCDLCGTLRGHSTEEHRCRICLKLGEHRSKNCPMHTPSSPATAVSPVVSARPPSRGRRTPRSGNLASLSFCSFCGKDVTHKSEEHICRLCRVTGLHRSGDCPSRGMVSSSSQSVLSYSVKVRDRVLESIPLVLPASASTLVFDSIDKVGDVDTILKRTLQRIGVWGGGSQTPITTPYAAPAAASQPRSVRQSFVDASLPQQPLPALENVDGSGVYVVSYAEGRSVIPERVLKYMRLLMHHEISTNAFSVVVVFDPSPSTWELQKPGMVTPRSLPSSPTMSEQLKKRMAKYTLQTLLGTRDKLVKLVVAQKKMQMQLQEQQQQRGGQQVPVPPTQAPAMASASS